MPCRRAQPSSTASGTTPHMASTLPRRTVVMDATGTDRNHPTRALLIDDDEGVRNVIHDIVTSFGYVTDAATNGPEGLALFEKNLYDVVLTDLLMPGMTGWEVLQALRRLDPKIPVVIVTGANIWADDYRILQPAVALVRKPVDMTILEMALLRVLGDLAQSIRLQALSVAAAERIRISDPRIRSQARKPRLNAADKTPSWTRGVGSRMICWVRDLPDSVPAKRHRSNCALLLKARWA